MNCFATASLLLLLMLTPHGVLADEAGSLTPQFLTELQEGYQMNVGDQARHNAVTNNSLSSLALNRGIVRGDDGYFSHRIQSKGITNQKSSGRCWMFAGLNVIRPQVIRDHNMEEFEFSTSYLQFWDKLEKSNLYFESVIELRDAGFVDRDWEVVNKWTLGDGGWWNYVTGLVGKYGVVPASVMPETQSSENTKTFNHILDRLVRSRAARIFALHEKGVKPAALRTEKRKALKEIYRFLVINLGEPPTEFEWRYKLKKKKEEKSEDEDATKNKVTLAEETLSPSTKYTPQSFYEKFVGVQFKDYVCLYNEPQSQFGKHYEFGRTRNIVGKQNMHFINIPINTMKEIAVKSILANEPLWFAANVGIDQSRELGLMQHDLYDYESLFDIDLTLSKADRTRFHAGVANHAMVLMGVDLVDGKSRKWLVENSWGDKKGSHGTWSLYDSWFDEHVYNIIVHKRHVPSKILERFKDKPSKLPSWYPGARGE